MMNSALSDNEMMNDRQSDNKEFLIKIYNNSLLVICDKEILSKKFETIKFNKSFYEGKEVDEKEVLELIKKYDNINVFGNKIVDLLISHGYIRNFKEIEGVKFAIIVRIRR